MTDERKPPINVTEDSKSLLLESVNSLKRWTVILYVALAVVAVGVFIVRSVDIAHVESNANENRAALCALREDLHRRIESSVRFLDNNPGGIPGLPAKEIRTSIQNQRRTIQTLKVIDCTEVVVP